MSTNGVALRDLPNKVVVTGPDTINVLSGGPPGIQGPPGPSGTGTGTSLRKNSTGTIFARSRINFIEGANVTITIADDAGNDEIDITIASTGGGGGDPAMGGDLTGVASAAQIAAGAVGVTELASDSVTNIKILDGTIAETKFAFAIATQAELDASALLSLVKSPADSARNTITSTGVTVTPLTLKSFAGQTGQTGTTDAPILRFVTSTDQVWAEFRPPMSDPMPAPPAVGTGRLDFPFMGAGKGPVGVSTWQSLFNGIVVQGISLGYNYEGGGGTVIAAEGGAAWVVETNYKYDATHIINEWYCEHLSPGGGSSVRCFYVAYEFGAATLQLRLQPTVLKASQWDFIGANTNTEAAVARLQRNGFILGAPDTAANTLIRIQAAAGRYSQLGLGANGVDDVMIFYCDSATHANFNFSGREGLHVHKPASGSSVSIGVNWNVAMLLVKNDQAVGTSVIIAQGKAGQTGNLFQAWTSAETPTWAINNLGHEVFADSFNIIFGTGAGTKIGTSAAQLFAFWNAVPIIQPTTAVAAAAFVSNTSLIANDTATFDGYTIGKVVKALRNVGLLA